MNQWLEHLCRNFAVIADGRRARATALANASGMTVLAKGPDTMVCSPDGRCSLAPPAPSWLSVAGTGDVLAGIAVSRMATGLNLKPAALIDLRADPVFSLGKRQWRNYI